MPLKAYAIKIGLPYVENDPRRNKTYEARYHFLYEKLLKLEEGDVKAMSRMEIEEFTRMEFEIYRASEIDDDMIPRHIERQRKNLLLRIGEP